MIARMIGAAALAALTTTSLAAQESVYWPAPAATTGQQAAFPLGTPLTLATRYELSSHTAKTGDRVNLELAEPLSYRGQVVVPAGALAVGEIRRVGGNAVFGKGGLIEVQLRYLQTPYGPVRLAGTTSREGRNQRVLSIGGALFVAWPMLFIQGRSGKFPAGNRVAAQLLDDLRFPLAAPGATTALAAR